MSSQKHFVKEIRLQKSERKWLTYLYRNLERCKDICRPLNIRIFFNLISTNFVRALGIFKWECPDFHHLHLHRYRKNGEGQKCQPWKQGDTKNYKHLHIGRKRELHQRYFHLFASIPTFQYALEYPYTSQVSCTLLRPHLIISLSFCKRTLWEAIYCYL